MAIRRVQVTGELITEVFLEGYKTPGIIECIKGLPEGSRFSDGWYDYQKRIMVFSFETPGPIGENDTFDPVFRTHYVNAD